MLSVVTIRAQTEVLVLEEEKCVEGTDKSVLLMEDVECCDSVESS